MKSNLVKKIKALVEEAKAAIRRLRDDFRNSIKKEKEFSQNQKVLYEGEMEKIVNDIQEKLNIAEKKKIAELES